MRRIRVCACGVVFAPKRKTNRWHSEECHNRWVTSTLAKVEETFYVECDACGVEFTASRPTAIAECREGHAHLLTFQCKGCGEPFTSKRGAAQFHSPACFEEWQRRVNAGEQDSPERRRSHEARERAIALERRRAAAVIASCTSKRRFSGQQSVIAAALRLSRRTGRPWRGYRCDNCAGWHLTASRAVTVPRVLSGSIA